MATRQIVKGDFIGLPWWLSSLTNTGHHCRLATGFFAVLWPPYTQRRDPTLAKRIEHAARGLPLFDVKIPAQSPWNRNDDKPLRHDTGCRGMAATRAGLYTPLKPTKHERPPA
jgi:hypothetical protein